MTIGLASDHRGYKAKKFLKDSLYKYDVIDYGLILRIVLIFQFMLKN